MRRWLSAPHPVLGGLPLLPRASMGLWPASVLALFARLAVAWGGVFAWHVLQRRGAR